MYIDKEIDRKREQEEFGCRRRRMKGETRKEGRKVEKEKRARRVWMLEEESRIEYKRK